MKKGTKIAAGILIGSMIAATGVYGAFSDSLDVVNRISVGDVHISVSEFAQKGTGEVQYKDPENVIPGQKISKIPRITNYALPCWIRAKIDWEGGNEELEGLTDTELSGISEDWVKRGEYYYYTKVLKKRESADFFKAVTIPEEWTEKHALQKLRADIQADAIQAANFTPDFTAMSPWGNQKIQQCVHETNGALTCRKGETKLSVEFNGKAHRLVAVPDDFFTNLQTAMPGDILRDTVTVANTTKNEAEIFFHTGTQGRSQQQMKMLKEIRLKIWQGNRTLYEGTLDSQEMSSEHSLGVLKTGQKDRIQFQIEIPQEWDNSYALQKTDVTWTFSVKEDENISEDVPDGETGARRGISTAVDYSGTNKKKGVKTGDETHVERWILLFIGTGAAVLALKIFKGGEKS
ncbi:hypothetical protein [Blautia sp. MSJ-19]|uniref:hypothetical protein n=1 Tax=Blautia sp. MSJ-19 TaxID=2841517 RepID=UPI001C0E8F62|nr:hypothetical protein [Blautia sp. MSJ-19]MBU5482306.1 hypothetical protein [Blautia sp. MSJ-19]